jgi:hypothetical protein
VPNQKNLFVFKKLLHKRPVGGLQCWIVCLKTTSVHNLFFFLTLKNNLLVTIEGGLFPLADTVAKLRVQGRQGTWIDAFFPPSGELI